MFDTEIGKVYNVSFIPYAILSVIVIYIIKKNSKNITKLINNKLEEDIEELKIEIALLKDDINDIKNNI